MSDLPNENSGAASSGGNDKNRSNEIDLHHLLSILWRRKLMIIACIAVFVISALVYSLLATKIYKFETVIRPGVLSVMDSGHVAYIDTPQNIKAMIDNESFKNKISQPDEANSENDQKTVIDVNVALPRNSDSIKIVLLTNRLEKGAQLLNQLNHLLKMEYSHIVQIHEANYTRDIEIATSVLNQMNAARRNFEEKIRITTKRIQELTAEIKVVEDNTAGLTEVRDGFLSSPRSRDDSILSTLLYSNTIQQNLQLVDQLKHSLESLELRQTELDASISQKESEILIKRAEISNLELKKKSIENIRVVKEPYTNKQVQKPNLIINVAAGFLGGLLVAVVLAFLSEYIVRKRHLT